MPLFEYECPACGKRFELLVRADTRPACPGCGSKKLEKLLSAHAAPPAALAGPPPCHRGHGGCNPGKCGSGRCGIE